MSQRGSFVSYYHILHQRRNDLKLSIQDVSNQTRLAPLYIQAIEEHNLDVFSDDFSFVRYFVHAYADAIGVNWQAIATEVDEDVKEFAHQRDMALTQAQRRMVAQMPSVKKEKSKKYRRKKKKKTSFMQKQISQVTMYLHSKNSRMVKLLVLIGIVGLCGLSVLNFGLRYVSNQKQASIDKQKQAELEEKEAQTDILASERKKAQEADALVISAIDGKENTYQISNIQDDMKTLDLKVTLPSNSKITLKKDDTVINNESKVYTNSFSHSLEVSENCTFELSIETYSDNEISLDGRTIKFDKTNWTEGNPAVITLQLGTGNPNAQVSTDTTDEDSIYDDYDYDYDYSYDDSSYYQEDTGYEDEYTEQTDTY